LSYLLKMPTKVFIAVPKLWDWGDGVLCAFDALSGACWFGGVGWGLALVALVALVSLVVASGRLRLFCFAGWD
jgi:hypothetical protein